MTRGGVRKAAWFARSVASFEALVDLQKHSQVAAFP